MLTSQTTFIRAAQALALDTGQAGGQSGQHECSVGQAAVTLPSQEWLQTTDIHIPTNPNWIYPQLQFFLARTPRAPSTQHQADCEERKTEWKQPTVLTKESICSLAGCCFLFCLVLFCFLGEGLLTFKNPMISALDPWEWGPCLFSFLSFLVTLRWVLESHRCEFEPWFCHLAAARAGRKLKLVFLS